MLVSFEEILPSGCQYAWKLERLDSLDAVADCQLDGPLSASCQVFRTGRDRLEIEGHLSGTVQLVCDRCLVVYPFALDCAFQVRAEYRSADAGFGRPSAGEDTPLDDLDLIELDKPVLDLDALMREQLLLSLPEKHLCQPDCAGLCPRCGARKNENDCGCAREDAPSAFAKLASLSVRTDKKK